eukprot:764955-Hanusia_phi.AAC.7
MLNSFITFKGYAGGNCIDNCIHMTKTPEYKKTVCTYIGSNRENVLDNAKNNAKAPIPRVFTNDKSQKSVASFFEGESKTLPLILYDKGTHSIDTFSTSYFSDHSPVLFLIDEEMVTVSS